MIAQVPIQDYYQIKDKEKVRDLKLMTDAERAQIKRLATENDENNIVIKDNNQQDDDYIESN